MYQYKPAKVGIGIGAFGVAFTLLTTTLLILIPQEFMSPATSSAYIETWSKPIMALGQGVMVYGLPLLSAGFAYYLTTNNHSVKNVVTGFILGGLVLGLGDALLGETVLYLFENDPALGRSMISHVSRILTLGGRLVGGALIATLVAVIVKDASKIHCTQVAETSFLREARNAK